MTEKCLFVMSNIDRANNFPPLANQGQKRKKKHITMHASDFKPCFKKVGLRKQAKPAEEKWRHNFNRSQYFSFGLGNADKKGNQISGQKCTAALSQAG